MVNVSQKSGIDVWRAGKSPVFGVSIAAPATCSGRCNSQNARGLVRARTAGVKRGGEWRVALLEHTRVWPGSAHATSPTYLFLPPDSPPPALCPRSPPTPYPRQQIVVKCEKGHPLKAKGRQSNVWKCNAPRGSCLRGIIGFGQTLKVPNFQCASLFAQSRQGGDSAV